MKRYNVLFLPILLLLKSGCNQTSSDLKNKPETTENCYISLYKQDTAHLNLNFKYTEVTGKLRISYADGKTYDGVLKGRSKGDTLLLDYDFKISRNDQWYRNPLAILKRGDSLILGDGKIDVRWGTGVFDKNVPINYEDAKFVFRRNDCKTAFEVVSPN